MASSTVIVDKDASCANEPDFAVICAFFEKFSEQLQLNVPDFKKLQEWLSNTDEVPTGLRDLHIKLMRKTRRTVHECAWESALSKFCFWYSSQDGWEIERFGYKKSSLKVKLRILRQLLENQFDRNNKFRANILAMSADSLRSQPIGRDRLGHSYWLTQDSECNIRIYQEHLDEEIWQVVATNREELVKLISRLKGNEVVLPSDIGFIDEDSSSNSCSVPIEKPPPPEEKDDSQESNQSLSGRVPNIKIKLGNKDNGNIATVSTEPEEPPGGGENDAEMEEEKKVKPLVISQSKIKLEVTKKRSLDEGDKVEPQEVKKQRPTLLDSNREKKLGRYEKQEEDEEEDDHDEGEEEEDGEEEVDDEGEEEEEDENSGDDEGEEEEEDADEIEGEEEEDEDEKEEIEIKKVKPITVEPSQKLQKIVDALKENTSTQEIKKNSNDIAQSLEASFKKDVPKLENKISKEEVHKSNVEKVSEGQTSEKSIEIKAEEEKLHTKEQENIPMEENEPVPKKEEKETKIETVKEISTESAEITVKQKEEIQVKKEDTEIPTEEKEVPAKPMSPKTQIRDEDKKENVEDGKEVKDDNLTKVHSPIVGEKINDKPESDHIELPSEDVEMKDLTNPTEEKINEAEVSEAIEDPPVIVKEEGSGAECENGFDHLLYYNQDSDEESLEFSEEIEETPIYIQGEGSGAECLVGNAKTSQAEEKATFFFGQPGCLKLSPEKNQAKSEDSEDTDCNDNTEKPKELVKKIIEPTNGENHSESEPPKKGPKVPSPVEKKTNKTESKNGNQQEDRRPTRRTLMNRKRRLSDEKPEKPPVRPSSESETDLNSENLEDQIPDEEEEDIGGKRLKMRSKLVNTEIRKKVEAQRKTATKEETTTSSSGGEEECPRKKVIVKKVEKVPEKAIPLKAKLKQKPKVSPVAPKNEKVEDEKDELVEEKEEDKSSESVITNTPTSSSVRLLSKQIKKPHPVELNDESDEEIPAKKQPQEKTATKSSPQLLNVSKAKSLTVDTEKPKTSETKNTKPPDPLGEEEQCPSDKQRKRRSSEEDSKETPLVPPVVVKSTRSSRRSGPVEPAIELPQIKRTRVKAAIKAEVKNEVKPEVKSEETPEVISQPPKEDESKKVTPKIKEEKEKEDKEKKEEKADEEKSKVEKIKEEKKEDVKPKEIKKEEEVVPIKENPVTKNQFVSTRPRQQKAAQKQPATSTGQRRKHHDDVDTKNIIDLDADGAPVRMSRRIAQLKIREEADRRKMEEIALRNMKAELKKKKKAESKPEDPPISEPSQHSSDQDDSEVEVKKKAEKKKKLPGKDGWSSGSEELDEEEVEEHPYEIDHGSPLFKSDHEFSPESDLEDDSQVVPLKRARTARKEGYEDELEEHSPDESCQKCGKSDHPEWILLCDKCNKGYHCSCLSPVIFYIPEGDWFCPPCQQEVLIVALENHLIEFDNLVQQKKDEEEEKIRLEQEQRLEMEKATLDKAERKIDRKLTKKQKVTAKKGKTGRASAKNKKKTSDDDDSDGEENVTETDENSNSSNSSSSGSGSTRSKSSSATDTDDEPIYKLRKRRQINVSYRLNEYDEMIKSALKKEEDAVAGAGNLGRGKDISNVYESVDEEPLIRELKVEENGAVSKPSGKTVGAEDSGSDFEPIKRKPKTGRNAKKKHRKLTKLDISSEGDNDSDEDFRTSSMDDDEEEDEDEEDVSQSSDSSLEVYRRRRGSRKGKKKKSRRAARRSARERRKDRKFIVDDSDCDGSEPEVRSRSKKKRKKDSDYTETETNDDDDEELSENIDSDDLCDDSTDSEASDGAWAPSKRKKQRSNAIAKKSPKHKPKMGSKAKKTKRYDSDGDSFKASKSKSRVIRDDSDDDDDDDSDDSVDSSRKTRGKKCIYMEDYDDESSDGGIKPGVKRPDTPPEEREKFIKKQEEIKRMLAEKNAEGAKLAATPRLVPIKTGAQRSPAKLDSLSTVPLAVIRQAKVLDIDYLQRKGESISEGDLDESEFDDDDLPDDFNPEDMDEEAIARMVEEDFAQQQQLKLPLPSEVLRKKPARESEPTVRPVSTYMPPHVSQQQQSSSTSGLQEPVRKKLPMPTIHPPLLRHGYGQPMMQQNRQSHLPLLQNALSTPLNHPMSRQFPPTSQAIPATNQVSQQQGGMQAGGGDPNKPRGRRKKITPLRDPLQKQQAAAAASAASAAAVAAATKPRPDGSPQEKPEVRQQPPPPPAIVQSATPGVIKSALSIAQPPQLYKPPVANTQPSVITRMPHLQARPMMHMGGGPGNGPPFPDQGPRFYRPPHPQSHLRPQAQHQQPQPQQQQQQQQRQPPPQLQQQQQRLPPPQHQQPQQRPPPPQHQQRPPPPQHQQRPPPPQHQQRPPPPQQSQSQQHRPPPPASQSQSPSQPNSLIPGNRPPMRHRGPQMPPMTSHHSMRPSFVGGPPPLRPSSSGGPPPPISLGNNIVRDQGPPRQSSPYSGPEQYTGPPPPSRHSAPPPPPHLSPYRPQMFNNPGFPHRGPPVNSSQPSLIRPVGAPPPEYSAPGSFGGNYGYYPPPLSVPHSAPPPPAASAVPSSVIVSASSLGASTSVVVAPPSQPVAAIQPPSRPPVSSPSLLEKPSAPPVPAATASAAAPAAPLPPSTSTTIPTSVIELSRKKLTTLETFNTSKNATPPPLRESSESRSPYSSNPPTIGGPDDAPDDLSGSPPSSSQSTSEFSGLVSYFSSQHDDLNT